jgi:DNA-binding response OmpR family regulator
MGMNLSDIPALDLLKQIRDDSDIPVVIISDSTDIQKLVEAFDDGANDYILKPFNQRIFTTRLKTLLIRERKLNRVKR